MLTKVVKPSQMICIVAGVHPGAINETQIPHTLLPLLKYTNSNNFEFSRVSKNALKLTQRKTGYPPHTQSSIFHQRSIIYR